VSTGLLSNDDRRINRHPSLASPSRDSFSGTAVPPSPRPQQDKTQDNIVPDDLTYPLRLKLRNAAKWFFILRSPLPRIRADDAARSPISISQAQFFRRDAYLGELGPCPEMKFLGNSMSCQCENFHFDGTCFISFYSFARSAYYLRLGKTTLQQSLN
jgi:hypothetical protein